MTKIMTLGMNLSYYNKRYDIEIRYEGYMRKLTFSYVILIVSCDALCRLIDGIAYTK